MQPVLLYYANLLLCGMVFLELVFTFRKNPMLKVCFLLIVASLFVMNYFAVTGIDTRVQFVFARFMRLVYATCTLLALAHLVQRRIPRWMIVYIAFTAVIITGLRLAFYDQINIQALPDVPNHVFSVGVECYTPKLLPRILILSLAMFSIVIGYYYYRRLLMKLNYDSVNHKHLSRWVIAMVVPFFMLTIFGILGNLKIVDETLSVYLFAIFSCTTVCSLVLRPKFLDSGMIREIASRSTVVG